MKKKIAAIFTVLTLALTTTTVFAYTDIYTVREGDTLFKIATAYDVNISDIVTLNKLENPSKIYIGDKIYITVPGKSSNTGLNNSTISTETPKNGIGAATTDNSTTTTPPTNITKPPTTNNNNTSTSTDSSGSGGLTAPTDAINTDMANQVLNIVNIERKKAGVKPLALSTDVNAVAQVKANDMATNGYFDHNSPTYGSPFNMLTNFGVDYKSAGENIAKGQKDAQSVMTAWINSPGHKANILNPNFTHLGIGYRANNGYPVWVQMFITK